MWSTHHIQPRTVLALSLGALACSGAAAASGSIEQYNMTLTFASTPTQGKYISGDYWVVGPATLVATSPAAAGGRNGFEVSPSSTFQNGLDSRTGTYNASLLPALPLTLKPGDSLLKVISGPDWKGSNPTYLQAAMVLTVVAEPPRPGSYRPGYFHTDGFVPPTFHSAELQWATLPSIALPPAPPGFGSPQFEPPPLSWVQRRFAMPQLDHIFQYIGAEIHPVANMPGAHYGEPIAQDTGLAVSRLLLNDAPEAKAAAAHGLVQYGIDIGAIVAAGNPNQWNANGGWQNGRKIVLGLAALVLGGENMTAVTGGYPVLPTQFSEDTEVTVSTITSAPGRVLWGSDTQGSYLSAASYWKLLVTGDGDKIQADPYGLIDGGGQPGGYYDFCCVFKPWKGSALPMLVSPALGKMVNSTPMVEYVKRRARSGYWTQPDVCAPPTGKCSDGSGNCKGYLNQPCGSSGKGKCVLDMSEYNTTWGMAADGGCIKDTDAADGIGRFPSLHGTGADAGDGGVPFVDRLWASLVQNSTHVVQ